jgi:hypothetical protein
MSTARAPVTRMMSAGSPAANARGHPPDKAHARSRAAASRSARRACPDRPAGSHPPPLAPPQPGLRLVALALAGIVGDSMPKRSRGSSRRTRQSRAEFSSPTGSELKVMLSSSARLTYLVATPPFGGSLHGACAGPERRRLPAESVWTRSRRGMGCYSERGATSRCSPRSALALAGASADLIP